ncbi:MAG: LysR family transcriptional regulator [marine bacterium B5-7]|nr:MAG: LysR family transcriptional regulator [marine bacterium B5-7]
MKDNFDLITLRVVVAAAGCGSISAAGDQLELATAAASARITALEKLLGFRIFERSPRGVHLTPNGNVLVERARRIIADADRLYTDMYEYRQGLEGHVHVLANSSSLLQILPDVLSSFAQQSPRIQVEVEERSSSQTQRALLDGLADVGVVDAPIRVRGIDLEDFFRDDIVIVVHVDHPLAQHERVHLNTVLDEEFIALIESTALSARLAMSASYANKTLRIRMRMHGFDAITRMVAAGLGVGMLPLQAIRPQLATLPIKAIRLCDTWATRVHRIATRRDVPVSPAAKTFIAALRSERERHNSDSEEWR